MSRYEFIRIERKHTTKKKDTEQIVNKERHHQPTDDIVVDDVFKMVLSVAITKRNCM